MCTFPHFVFIPKSAKQEKLWIEALRDATVAQRFALSTYMTKIALEHAHRDIAEAYPELTPEERKVKFVELHYGKELAVGLREYLRQRRDTAEP